MEENEFLNELGRRYPGMVLVPADKQTHIMEWARDAYHMIARGTEIMDIELIMQWEGVRACLETCPLSDGYLAAQPRAGEGR